MVESNNAAELSLKKQESMSSIVTAREEILVNRKAFSEVKSFANPPKKVFEVMKVVQAFVTDKKAENIDWAACKNGILK